MATDQSSTSNSTSNNETVANGSRSPTEGGFTPAWSQEAEQRIEARRTRVQAAAAEAPRVPPQSHPVTEEIDDDEEEREFLILVLREFQFKVKFYCRRYKAWIG